MELETFCTVQTEPENYSYRLPKQIGEWRTFWLSKFDRIADRELIYVDLRYIQELLGHTSSKTTEIYTHVAAHKIMAIRSPVAGLLKGTQ